MHSPCRITMHPSVYQSIHTPVHPSIHSSIYLSIYLYVHTSIYPSIYLSTMHSSTQTFMQANRPQHHLLQPTTTNDVNISIDTFSLFSFICVIHVPVCSHNSHILPNQKPHATTSLPSQPTFPLRYKSLAESALASSWARC